MGIMNGSGCFSCVLGPIFISFVYTHYGTYFTFGSISVLMFSSMLWLWVVRDKLVPPIYEKSATEMIEIVAQKDSSQENQNQKTEKNLNDNISKYDKSEDMDQLTSLLKKEDDDRTIEVW